jgi:threonine dehydrogenase-like Zn-dependent dehydrogenase
MPGAKPRRACTGSKARSRGPVKIPEGLTDEQVLFLGDMFPTGWQAAVQCDIAPTDVVAVWGAGPIGQFAIRSLDYSDRRLAEGPGGRAGDP